MLKIKGNNLKINAHTELFCIFGKPVRHSLSPLMHNAAFRYYGINALYMAFEVDSINDAIKAMKVLGIRGASVTIPHKEKTLRCVDFIDPLAKDIGAINTLVNYGGRISGYNTDGRGAIEALKTKGVRIKGSNIMVIGNGGSARSIAFSFLSEGARVTIAGRNSGRILKLVKNLEKKYKKIDFILINNLNKEFMNDIDIIVNTTPAGMSPDIDNTPIDTGLIQKKHAVFDIIYSPPLTKLLRAGKDLGCEIFNGLDMLVNQGALQFELWTGKKAPVKVMRDSLK